MAITWKEVPGYPGYEASSDGRIKVLATGHITKGGDAGRYLKTEVLHRGERKLVYMHHLVALAHLGPVPKGKVVMHKDDDKKNNAVSNLKYGTQSENVQEAYDRGLVPGKSSVESLEEILHGISVESERVCTLSATLETLQDDLSQLQYVEDSLVESFHRGELPATDLVALTDITVGTTGRKYGIVQVSNESLSHTVSLEQIDRIKVTATKLATTLAKTLKEAWKKLMTWFELYRGKVKDRCAVLSKKLRSQDKTTITKATTDTVRSSVRASRERIAAMADLLRTAGKEPSQELVDGLDTSSKELASTAKDLTGDKIPLDADDGTGVKGDALVPVVREVELLNEAITNVTSYGDRIMRSIDSFLKKPKDGSDNQVPDKGHQVVANKLSRAIQAATRATSTITERTLSAINKATKPIPKEEE